MLSNIEEARKRGALPNACPFCGSLALFVVESRPLPKGGRRRRKRCDRCAEKFTTYEISQEEYKALRKGKATPKATPSLSCDTCIHWEKETTSCGFDFPEAGGWFAADCSCYQGSG
jgi:hypothetical protein